MDKSGISEQRLFFFSLFSFFFFFFIVFISFIDWCRGGGPLAGGRPLHVHGTLLYARLEVFGGDAVALRFH